MKEWLKRLKSEMAFPVRPRGCPRATQPGRVSLGSHAPGAGRQKPRPRALSAASGSRQGELNLRKCQLLLTSETLSLTSSPSHLFTQMSLGKWSKDILPKGSRLKLILLNLLKNSQKISFHYYQTVCVHHFNYRRNR